jgi:hypothetical protein
MSARSLLHGPALVLLAIAAIWLLAASRWIVTDTVVPWDAKNQFYAFFRFLATAIHSGESPFWNPYHYGGHPSVADPQSLIFSPPFVLWALFDPAPSIRAFDLIVYAHLGAGGLAVGLAGVGVDPGCRDLHARRAGLRTVAAFGHNSELRALSVGASFVADGAAAALACARSGLRRGGSHDGARTQPRGLAVVLRHCRRSYGRDRGRRRLAAFSA